MLVAKKTHKEYMVEYSRMREANGTSWKDKHPEYLQSDAGKEMLRKSRRKYKSTHKDEVRCLQKDYRLRNKKKVFIHYGGSPPTCACCGEKVIEFLSLDHMNGGGSKHRLSVGGHTDQVYRWIIKNNFPQGFQILCMNCNWGKRLCNVCPHKN